MVRALPDSGRNGEHHDALFPEAGAHVRSEGARRRGKEAQGEGKAGKEEEAAVNERANFAAGTKPPAGGSG